MLQSKDTKLFFVENQLSDWKDKYKKLSEVMRELNDQNTELQKVFFI